MQIQELITKDHHFLQQFFEICIQFETTEQKVYHDIFASSNVLSRLLTFWFFMSGNALWVSSSLSPSLLFKKNSEILEISLLGQFLNGVAYQNSNSLNAKQAKAMTTCVSFLPEQEVE